VKDAAARPQLVSHRPPVNNRRFFLINAKSRKHLQIALPQVLKKHSPAPRVSS
jgi:hypothetical protein